MLTPTRLRKFLVKTLFAMSFWTILIGTSQRLSAQAISGDLVGVVTDPSGAVVSGLKVEAVNTATGVKFDATTAASGEYRFTNLQVGHYSIQASGNSLAGGYKDVTVQLNQTVTANITAAVSANATSVEVNSSAVTIDTTTSQIQTTFDTKQLQDLPTTSLGTNGVLNLSLLNAGASSSGGVGEGTGPALSGQRPTNNNFTIEGVDNNNKTVPGPVMIVPNDAVQNFTVLQNQFSPEFGHSSGGQFNTVVISGTNQFHGRAYEYFQNRNLNAIASLAKQTPTPNPRYDNNRFGLQIGGPIIRNKIFFFTDQQYNPVGQVGLSSNQCAPTTAGYTTLSALPGVSAANLALLKQYVGVGTPNSQSSCHGTLPTAAPGGAFEIGEVDVSGPNFTNTYTTVNSIDVNISPRDQLRFRYLYSNQAATATGPANPIFWLPSPTKQHLVAISEYHTFTPMVLNEFRLGYNRSSTVSPFSSVPFPTANTFPNINIDDTGAQIGPGGPNAYTQNLYQVTDNVTWTKGKHTFTLGGEARKYIAPTNQPNRINGDYEWSTTDLFLRDVAPDVIGQRSSGNNPYYADQTAFYGYANDNWRISPNFTANLGIRYEFTAVPVGERQQTLNSVSSVPGLISFTAPQPQYRNFVPRLGFAYSPGVSGHTSIRGGFSMAYDVLYDNLGRAYRPPQIAPYCDVAAPSSAVCPFSATAFLANGGFPGATGPSFTTFPSAQAARAATGFFIPNQTLPYSENWTLGIQHIFSRKYTVEVRYVGTRGIHLTAQILQNRIDPITATHNLPTYLSAPNQALLNSLPLTLNHLQTPGLNVAPAYYSAGFTGSLTMLQPYGASNYNGLQTQFNRSFDKGLQFQVAYTYSHTLDNSTADVSSTTLTPRRPQNDQDIAADYSTSSLDHRHRVTVQMIYDVPFFKHSSNWLEKNVAGNWEVGPIYTMQSAGVYTPQSGVDSNLNGDTAPDRTIINPGGVAGTGSAVTPLKNSSNQIVAYLATNPSAQYIQAGLGAYANAGRNTGTIPRINNFDLTSVKRVTSYREYAFEFQAQAYNVLNHSQYTAGSINAIDSIGSFTGAQTKFINPSNPSFNNPKVAFSNNARSLQLVAKFIF